jgi:hypothetical protein
LQEKAHLVSAILLVLVDKNFINATGAGIPLELEERLFHLGMLRCEFP